MISAETTVADWRLTILQTPDAKCVHGLSNNFTKFAHFAEHHTNLSREMHETQLVNQRKLIFECFYHQ